MSKSPEHPFPEKVDLDFELLLTILRAGDVGSIIQCLKLCIQSESEARRQGIQQIQKLLRARDTKAIREAIQEEDLERAIHTILNVSEARLAPVRQGKQAQELAEALRDRSSAKLKRALRGRNPEKVMNAFRSRTELLAALSSIDESRRGKPLTDLEVSPIIQALPNDPDLDTICSELEAELPQITLPEIPAEEANAIGDALHQNRDLALSLIQKIEQRYQSAWIRLYESVSSQITNAICAQLFKTIGIQDRDRAESAAISMFRSLMSKARKGALQEYDIPNEHALAGLLFQIGWNKCRQRMRRDGRALPLFIQVEGEDEEGMLSDPAEWRDGPLQDLLRQDIAEQTRSVLKQLEDELDCREKNLLKYKLLKIEGERSVTDEGISFRIESECPNESPWAAGSIPYHWKKLKEKLILRLSSLE